MTSPHDGHLIHKPSGTRLSFFACGSIGLRTFLNQAIALSLSDGGRRTETEQRGKPEPQPATAAGRWTLLRPRHVVARALAHPVQLLHQVVERVVAPTQIEL